MFSKISRKRTVFSQKFFQRNDAGSLKLTVSFYVGGFKGYC